MKVACVGNMNNMFFSLVRYLRDEDVDASLFFCNDEFKHYYPNNDTYSEDYKDYCHQLTWGGINTFSKSRRKDIRETFAKFDFIIATDKAIGFLADAKITIDVIFPSGSEFTTKSKVYKSLSTKARIVNPKLYRLSKAIELGFKKATCINVESNADHYAKRIKELDISPSVYYFGFPMLYNKSVFVEQKYLREDLKKLIETLKQGNDFLFLNHNQLTWIIPEDEPHKDLYLVKGTHHIINGFANFLERTKCNAKLILLEYGQHVEETKNLVDELNIADNVVFLKQLKRIEILIIMKYVNVCFGQFEAGGIGGGTTWEAIGMGKPFIHYMSDEKNVPKNFKRLFPFRNAKNAKEISDTLVSLSQNPSELDQMAIDAASWYKEEIQQNCVSEWLKLISIKKEGGTQGLSQYISSKQNK